MIYLSERFLQCMQQQFFFRWSRKIQKHKIKFSSHFIYQPSQIPSSFHSCLEHWTRESESFEL
jgi:hypothetical protein